jgi:hypothetical protein
MDTSHPGGPRLPITPPNLPILLSQTVPSHGNSSKLEVAVSMSTFDVALFNGKVSFT